MFTHVNIFLGGRKQTSEEEHAQRVQVLQIIAQVEVAFTSESEPNVEYVKVYFDMETIKTLAYFYIMSLNIFLLYWYLASYSFVISLDSDRWFEYS